MPNQNLRAAAILTLAMALFAMEDAFIKTLAVELPFSQVLAMIGVGGLIVFGGQMWLRGERFWTRDLLAPAVVLRNVAEAVEAVALVIALGLVDLSTTSAILQAIPLFITLGAAIWLKERISWRRGAAIALGLVGVLMILRPGLEGFQPAALWAVLAAAALAARDLATRRAPRGMGSAQLSTSAFAAMLLGAVAMALAMGERPVMPDATQAALALGCVTMTVTGYMLLVRATRIGEASALAPVRYTRLVFVLILAVGVFGERLDALTIAGAVLIVGSGSYTLWREARLSRRALDAADPVPSAPARPRAA